MRELILASAGGAVTASPASEPPPGIGDDRVKLSNPEATIRLPVNP